MGHYFRQPVREADIRFIVNEITEFTDCIRTRQMLIDAFHLSPSIGDDLEQKYRYDNFNSYKYFREVISKWINWKGNEANTVELDKALRSIGWNGAADNLKKKWFSTSRSASAEANVWFNMRNPISPFASRKDTLEQVHNIFFPANIDQQDKSHRKIKSTQVAVVGLGGIGKSEFARKFAKKYYTEFDSNVVWINAGSAQLLQESFKEVAKKFQVYTITLSGRKELLEMIKNVYEYFSKSNSLFIFDNVEAWLDGEDAIKDYLPKGLNPCSKVPYILMTSRIRPKVSKCVAIVDLSVPKETKADKLIQHRLDTKNSKFPLQLAKLLGCLPLALQQAISYIQQEPEEDISGIARQEVVANCIQSYIKRFDTEAKKLLDYKDGDFDDDFEEYKTTWITWRLTLEKIQVMNPSAIQLLEMMSYISPDDIHLQMFEALLTVDDLKAAVNTLVRFSMITKNSEKSNIVSVHRLVQRVVRMDYEEMQEEGDEGDEDESLESMLNLLNIILDQLPLNITTYTTSCVIHAQVAWEHAIASPKLLKRFHAYYLTNLYNQAKLHGMHTSNLSLLRRTLSKYSEYNIYIESDEQYIAVQYLITNALLELHKHEDAKSLCSLIHETAAANLGKSHRRTLAILNNLARAESGLGNHSKQIIILDKVIAIRTASSNLGLYHKNTLTSLHNKAACLARMEKYDEALELFKLTLELKEKHHPEDRKSINSTRYMVAAMTQRNENFEEALQMFRNLHVELVESFGDSHTITLQCALGIGDCLLELGEYDEAMEVLKYNLNLANDNQGDVLT